MTELHTAPLFNNLRQEVLTSDNYYTPPWLFETLAITYDLDVAAAPLDDDGTRRGWVPAHNFYNLEHDGLSQPWKGTVWCNPPFSGAKHWARRFAEHGNGIMLVSIPGGKSWFPDLLDTGDALWFPSHLQFYNDRSEKLDNIPWPVVVVGKGEGRSGVARLTDSDMPGATTICL